MGDQQNTIKKPKGKCSLPKGEQQEAKKDKIAYTIKDKIFGEFNVLKSANGWWVDQGKVQHLIDAYKIDCTDEEACIYAGILLTNLQYFQEKHPDFLYIKKACKDLPCLTARKTINESLKENTADAWKYLERKRRSEFGPNLDLTSKGEKLTPQPNEIVFVDFTEKNAESQ